VLRRISWIIKRQSGTSHRILAPPGRPDVLFAYHYRVTLGPTAMKVLAQTPENLFLAGTWEFPDSKTRGTAVRSSWDKSPTCRQHACRGIETTGTRRRGFVPKPVSLCPPR
jgi:hypothetical protein